MRKRSSLPADRAGKPGKSPSRSATSAVRRQASDRVALKLQLNALKAADPVLRETNLSAWIRLNKPLLVVSGTIATGAGTTIAWIVNNIQNIEQAVVIANNLFKTPPASRSLDFDKLRLNEEPLFPALDNDPIITSAVLRRLMKIHSFSDVHSSTLDLHALGIAI
jgi:hypothetical protein